MSCDYISSSYLFFYNRQFGDLRNLIGMQLRRGKGVPHPSPRFTIFKIIFTDHMLRNIVKQNVVGFRDDHIGQILLLF